MCTSLQEANLLANRFDDEATTMLLEVKDEILRARAAGQGGTQAAERQLQAVQSVSDAIKQPRHAKAPPVAGRTPSLARPLAETELAEAGITSGALVAAAPAPVHAEAGDGRMRRPAKRLVFASDVEAEADDDEEEADAKAADTWERGSFKSWGGSSLRSSEDGHEGDAGDAPAADKVLHLKTLCGLKHDQPHATFKDLTASCARLLAADIVTSTSVTQLNLAGNSLGLGGGKAIALGIRANTSLVEVNVDGFPLPILQLKGLEPVPNNKLDFSSKKLAQASAILIASVIGAEATATNALRILNLRNNDIDDIGLSALSDAVADGALAWLERLFLNKNQIGNAGLTAFAEATRSQRLSMLKELGISLNRIGDPGLHALNTAIRAGMLPSLSSIEVFPNPASSDAQEGLMNFVNKKKRPPRLSPRKTHLGDPAHASHRSGTQASSHRSGSSG